MTPERRHQQLNDTALQTPNDLPRSKTRLIQQHMRKPRLRVFFGKVVLNPA